MIRCEIADEAAKYMNWLINLSLRYANRRRIHDFHHTKIFRLSVHFL